MTSFKPIKFRFVPLSYKITGNFIPDLGLPFGQTDGKFGN